MFNRMCKRVACTASVCVFLLLACTTTVESESASLKLVNNKPFEEVQVSGNIPCRLPCDVVWEGELTPSVQWFRQEVDRNLTQLPYYRIDSDFWYSKVRYERPQCIRRNGVYNCTLEIPYCSQQFAGHYRCNVTVPRCEGEPCRVSKRVDLLTISEDDGADCHFPEARNMSVVLREVNDTLMASLYWNATNKPPNLNFCPGSRIWKVRMLQFSNVFDTPDDFEKVMSSVEWVDTVSLRDTTFTFTGIDRSTYYLFQVQNENFPHRRQVFSSHVYFFGRQDPAHLITPAQTVHLEVGDDFLLECEATGTPTPLVRIYRDVTDQGLQEEATDNADSRRALTLTDVDHRDEGTYLCFAGNTLVNPPLGKRNMADWRTIRINVTDPDPEETPPPTIMCTTYTKAPCVDFIRTSLDIFTNRSDDNVDAIVKEAFNITSQDSHHERCLYFVKALACHSSYPYCDFHSRKQGRFVPRPICQHSCRILSEGECAGVIDPSSELYSSLLSRCDDSERGAGSPPECFHIPLVEAGEAEVVEDTGFCATGDGRGYRGNQRFTQDGLQCQWWVSQSPHNHSVTVEEFPEELRDARDKCRNPGSLGDRPWCYTSNPHVRWQYCSVPNCEVCEPYEGTFCRGIVDFNTTAIYRNKLQARVQMDIELAISGFYHQLTTRDDLELTPGCEYALKLFLCHTALPFCSDTEAGTSKLLCRDYCQLLGETEFCPRLREEIEAFMNTSSLEFAVPDCGVAPGGREECVRTPPRLESQIGLPVTVDCYADNGATYRGTVSVTESGIPCQRWDTDRPHPHHIKANLFPELMENYCRNPGQLGNKPWCYVNTTNGSSPWEYCAVPLCSADPMTSPNVTEAAVSHASTSAADVAYITISIIIFIFCFIIVIVVTLLTFRYYRTKRLQEHRSMLAQLRGSSAESKLHYNPQYHVMQPVIPQNISALIKDFTQFDKSDIKYVKQLGQGNFGVVFQGKAKGIVKGEEETMVAVKTLKEETSSEALENFVHEAKLMFSFDHPNIIKIHGVSMASLPYYMIFEYMDKGDLTQFLRSNASSAQRRFMNPFGIHSRTESTLSNDPAVLTTAQLVNICTQIAAGMEYLASRNHVHRDLACRNCLVKTGLTIKIGDFGMSHNLYTRDYYRVNGHAVLPVRWMSPEAVVYGKFSTAGDVWSFGVVMWEVFSFAMQPYYGISNEEVTEAIRRARILSKPLGCPNKAYEIMKGCWNMDSSQRPLFAELHQMLKDFRISESSVEDRALSFDQLSHADSDLSSDAFYEENSIDGLSVDNPGD